MPDASYRLSSTFFPDSEHTILSLPEFKICATNCCPGEIVQVRDVLDVFLVADQAEQGATGLEKLRALACRQSIPVHSIMSNFCDGAKHCSNRFGRDVLTETSVQ